MQAIVISGHGSRGHNTSAHGTYVVPPNVEICFFTEDSHLLNGKASDYFMDFLCTENPDEVTLRTKYVKEVKKEWDVIPNYEICGDSAFRDKTGVYLVGRPRQLGPLRELRPGEVTTLGALLSGARKGSACARRVYWLACREAKMNSYEETFARLQLGAERCPLPGGDDGTTNISAQMVNRIDGVAYMYRGVLWRLKGIDSNAFSDEERKARTKLWNERTGLDALLAQNPPRRKKG
jgi:hypothetical protein